LFGQFPFLEKLFADSAYAGPVFHDGLTNALPGLVTEIVRRCDQAKGFVVLPKRWIVERTIGWLGRCRRLAKDWENLNHNALAFLRLASIRLMLRRLCNPSYSLRTDSQQRQYREQQHIRQRIPLALRPPGVRNVR
jgi:transposase